MSGPKQMFTCGPKQSFTYGPKQSFTCEHKQRFTHSCNCQMRIIQPQ